MNHVLLTSGLNELPVLVAAYRLCVTARETIRVLPRFSVICSREAQEDAQRVKRALAEKLVQEKLIGSEAELAWKIELVDDPFRPRLVRECVTRILKELKDSLKLTGFRIHLHHTGGTSAMGIYSLEA